MVRVEGNCWGQQLTVLMARFVSTPRESAASGVKLGASSINKHIMVNVSDSSIF